jgi:ubiquinone/menaquinone biosynthesis C-methylase UbiE
MLKELLGGKMYLAPIGDNPQKIIDLGTGFGEWAIEGMWSKSEEQYGN